eukprot:1157492-Pelagomonas_calceolata.AAC.3
MALNCTGAARLIGNDACTERSFVRKGNAVGLASRLGSSSSCSINKLGLSESVVLVERYLHVVAGQPAGFLARLSVAAHMVVCA